MGRTRDQKRVAENIILVCSGRLFSKCFALKFGNNDDCTFLNSSVIFLIFIFPSVSNVRIHGSCSLGLVNLLYIVGMTYTIL